jgi:hypothetical protein
MRIRSVRTFVCAFLPSLLLALVVLSLPTASFAQIGVAITIGPPPIPIYEQPLCPGDGYLWVPGYWAYDYDVNDYYWVPGTWILAPEVGFFWTPGWWKAATSGGGTGIGDRTLVSMAASITASVISVQVL